jgi:D-aminopeptidase
VGETNDGYLNDLQGRHIRAEHVSAAIESASGGSVLEGAVGAGTGTMCFGWKGGIGTASRVLPIELGGFTLGALIQSNFGRPRDLVIAGVPIGRSLQPPNSVDARSQHSDMALERDDKGSIMIVLATDAPLDARQLWRLCVRAGAGLARVGSHYGHGSGDFVIGFSTANRVEHEPIGLVGTRMVVIDEARVLDSFFRAVMESVEEAIGDSLFGAETLTGRDDHVAWALPIDDVLALAS